MSNKTNNRKNLYQLVLCAVLIALATALGMVKLFHLPFGGSITPFQYAGCHTLRLLLRHGKRPDCMRSPGSAQHSIWRLHSSPGAGCPGLHTGLRCSRTVRSHCKQRARSYHRLPYRCCRKILLQFSVRRDFLW